jgi:hypothetical protein
MLEHFGIQLLACSLRSQENKLPTYDYNMVLCCFFNDSQSASWSRDVLEKLTPINSHLRKLQFSHSHNGPPSYTIRFPPYATRYIEQAMFLTNTEIRSSYIKTKFTLKRLCLFLRCLCHPDAFLTSLQLAPGSISFWSSKWLDDSKIMEGWW